MRFRTLITAAAVIPLTLVASTPATAAESNTVVIQGNGTISPGLGALIQNNNWSFTGTATVIGTSGILASYSCSVSGTYNGNLGGGTGNLNGNCGLIPLTCVAVYLLGNWYWACASATAVFHCTVTYTTINPTTSFDAKCLGHHVHVQ